VKPKIDINLQNKWKLTALHYAVRNAKSVSLVKLLLNADKVKEKLDVNFQDDKKRTVLHYAVLLGNKKMVELLLKGKVDVNIQDKKGSTALHYAAKAGNKKMIELLLEEEADVNKKDTNGKTALDDLRERIKTAEGKKKGLQKFLAETESDEHNFKCAICREEWLTMSDEVHVPICAPNAVACHTICQDCAVRLLPTHNGRRNRNGNIKCPYCRTVLERGNPENFVKDGSRLAGGQGKPRYYPMTKTGAKKKIKKVIELTERQKRELAVLEKLFEVSSTKPKA